MLYGREVGFGLTGRYDPRNGNGGSFVVTDVQWMEVGYVSFSSRLFFSYNITATPLYHYSIPAISY